ncbi:MAG: hypothetical protein WC866_02815 [Patescibacteria group bacterium]
MSQKTLKIVSIVLGIVSLYALQTGYFLIGGIALAANGVLVAVSPQKVWMRITGVLVMVYGLYIVAAVLGLFVSGLLAFIDPQIALYVGCFLLVVGLQIVRRAPKHRKIGLLIMAIGAILVAYGYGFLG